MDENFQGRAIGFQQIKDNFGFIVGSTTNVSSEDNLIWRLAWWAKIINYSFTPVNFFTGKGLGMSLASTDDILTSDAELRSPHNFHLNIMARFGVVLFIAWIYWIWLILKPMFKKQLSSKQLAIACILFVFIFNSSFDVFLEGPMGAFPFWTWVGLFFIAEETPAL